MHSTQVPCTGSKGSQRPPVHIRAVLPHRLLRPPCAVPQQTTTAPAPVATPVTAPPRPLVVQEVRGQDVVTLINRGAATQSQSTTQNGSSAVGQDYTVPPQEKLVTFLKSLFLPDGYPATTTPDYLPYQLWATPTHILGSVAHALTTSSLLQAVGVSAGPAATTAASAAIKWITKDGLGAMGRFFVGGSLSQEFDRDPRRWRMVAELLTSTGAGLEIATAAFPQHFLVLASMGHFTKALAKAMGKPVFRVIQTHFALDNNIGAVAAKEEVWEVVAQLTGYAVSLAVLTAVDAFIVEQGGVASGTELVAIWAVVQSTHICLRYRSLRSLVFRSINDKRGILLMSDHVAGRPLRPVTDINRIESFLPAGVCMEPKVHMGTVGLSDMFASLTLPTQHTPSPSPAGTTHTAEPAAPEAPSTSGNGASTSGSGKTVTVSETAAEQLLRLYEGEEYVLVWRDGEAVVVFREGASHGSTLRALYQACWLHHNQHNTATTTSSSSQASSNGGLVSSNGSAASSNGSDPSSMASTSSSESNGNGHSTGQPSTSQLGVSGLVPSAGQCDLTLLEASVRALKSHYGQFEKEAAAVGWDLASVLIGFGNVRFRTL